VVREWKVEVDRKEEAGHESVVGWKFAGITDDDAKAVEWLWMELVIQRSHLDTECTADEVEQEATYNQEAMGNVLDITAKIIRICTKSKRWWNANIRERRMSVRGETMRRGHS
jgi:hypothetical protein